MPSPDIFVMSDAVMFAKVLNGVAMMFNPSGGGSSGSDLLIGDGPMQMGLIGRIGITLGVILAVVKSLGEGGRIRIDQVLIGFIAYLALFSPKMQVNIVEVNTGYTESVANIPVGVAMTGVAASWFNTTLAQQFSNVFTATNNGAGVLDGGLASPLRMLQALRMTQLQLVRDQTTLSKSLAKYANDCYAHRPDVKLADAHASPKPVDYFLGMGSGAGAWGPAGVTVEYTDTDPLGVATDCATVASNLNTRINQTLATNAGAGSVFEKTLSVNLERKPGTVGGGGNMNGATVTDVTDSYTRLVTGVIGASAADFMRSSLYMHALYYGVECGSRDFESAAFWSCIADQNAMQESAKTVATSAGTYFQKTMVYGMNILFLLFFAMSPIIAVVMAVTGFQGMGIIAKYFVFGIWCQSWVPFAVVLNYIIEEQTSYELSRLMNIVGGINQQSYAQFYDIVSTKLMLASDLLAMTPLVSMALISGSMYALSNVAGKWGGQSHASGTNLSPAHLNNGPQNTYKGSEFSSQGMSVPGLAGGSSSLADMSPGAMSSYGSMTGSTSVDARIQSASVATAAAANEVRLAKVNQTGLAHQLSETGGSGTSGGVDKTDGYQITQGIGSTLLKKWGLDKGASEGMAHKLGAAAAMYVEGNTGAALQYARDSGLAKELAEHRAKANRTGVGGGGRVGLSEDDQLANDFRTTFTTGLGGTGDNKKMFNEIRGETAKLSTTSMHQLMGQYTQAVSDTQTKTNSHASALRREQSLTGTTGGGTNLGMNSNQPIVEFANKISGGRNGGNAKALEIANTVQDAVKAHLVASAATPAEGQALAAKYSALAQDESTNAYNDGASRSQAPLIGALSAARKLSQYAPQGTSQTGLAATMDAPAVAGVAANSSGRSVAPAPMPTLANATKDLAPITDAAPPVRPGENPSRPDGWNNKQGNGVVGMTEATIGAGRIGSSEGAFNQRAATVRNNGENEKSKLNIEAPTEAEGELARNAAEAGVTQGEKRLADSGAQTLLKGTPQGGIYTGAATIIGVAALRTALSGVGDKAASALIDHTTGGLSGGGGGHKPTLPGSGSHPRLPGPPSSGAGSGASRAAFRTAFSNGMSKLATKLSTRAVPGVGWAATAMDIADTAQGIHSVLSAQGYTNISPETIKEALVQGARASGWNVWEGEQNPSHPQAPSTMPNNIPSNHRRK